MLYQPWCDKHVEEEDNKQLWRLAERNGGRAAIGNPPEKSSYQKWNFLNMGDAIN